MEIISYQECEQAEYRISELQTQIDLEPIEQAELDRRIREVNEFKEKLHNFE